MPRLKFSLLSFLLFTVWSAALVGVYVRREPWVMDSKIYTHEELGVIIPGPFGRVPPFPSPDGTRTVNHYIANVVQEADSGNLLHIFVESAGQSARCFVDDDTLLFEEDMERDPHYRLYRRRYPEWWWGHFYRLEVWLAVLIPLFAVGRAVIARSALARRASGD